MIEVAEASPEDIDELVRLESALFEEDAGQHDPYADTTWPLREGHKDFQGLIGAAVCIVLVTRASDRIVGLLVGYATRSSPSRRPVEYAILRTMYVSPDSRRLGAATMLTERFLSWGRERGCAEAHVDHYAANRGAGRFYERIGFGERSISRALPR